jgi:transcriptional regulator with XRE-family HTH domain
MNQARELLSLNIKSYRRKLGITQEKLAELTGLSVQTIHDIEGRRTWISDSTLQKLSEALKIDIYKLLYPPFETVGAGERAGLPALITNLRQSIQADVDRRLDQFFAEATGEH